MPIRTTIPGLKFVVGKVFISRWFAEFFIEMLTLLMSEDVNLGRFPMTEIEISEWIKRIERLEIGGIDFSSWKGLHGIYKLAEVLRQLRDDSSFLNAIQRQLVEILPPEALDRIKHNLEKSAFDEVNRLCNEALKKAGAQGTFDMVGLLAIIRAVQTAYRCLARYRVSPIRLIEQARQGDRAAVLALIKLDNLFCQDGCTKSVLQKGLLSSDKAFNDQVARAQLFKPSFNRRDACEIYMLLLAGLGVKLPPMFKLKSIVDPDATTFPGDYAFEKCFERLKKGIQPDSIDDIRIDETSSL